MPKKNLLIVLLLVSIVLTACSKDKDSDKVKVGMQAASAGWPWYATFIDTMEKRAKDADWDLTVLGADGDVATQVNQIQDLIAAKVDYLIIGPLDGKLKEKIGQFPIIYSMGLFDYFTEPIAKAVLNNLYQLLSPGGRMIIGNFHASNPSRYYMEYWCDWFLIHRTEKEMSSLMSDSHGAEVSVFFEDTGSQMFLDIRKPDSKP